MSYGRQDHFIPIWRSRTPLGFASPNGTADPDSGSGMPGADAPD